MLQIQDYHTKKPLNLGEYTGPKTKASGGQFNCNDTICWPIGQGTESAFLELQRQINRFAVNLSFAPLTTDTFIGDRTISATKKVLAFIAGQGISWDSLGASAFVTEINNAGAGRPARVAISKWAEELASLLSTVANRLDLPSPTGEIVRYERREPPMPESTVTPFEPPAVRTAGLSRMGWGLVAVGLLAAAGFGYWLLTQKPEDEMAQF